MDDATTLYRPVGTAELDLIRESRYTRFPPRLPHQPIFYPVLSEEYAREIAQKWNTRDEQSGYAGYVTKFRLKTDFVQRFIARQVGDTQHRELWIPADSLEEMNRNLVGRIEVIAQFFGSPANSESTS
ncbi:MAG: hypothetical protein WCF68_21710 [Terriglobales bacterium]